MNLLLTTAQLAKKLGVSGACVRQWKAEGRIKPVIVVAGTNQPLYAAGTKKPKPLKRGPKATR